MRATIVVTAEPMPRPLVARLAARGWARRVVVVGAVALATAAAAVIVTPGSARHAAPAPRPGAVQASTDRDTTMFGVRVECPRLALVSPDGQYARADYETASPCGSYGNYVTLILHRVRGAWVQEFVGTAWRCPASMLPARVAIELQLCPRPAGSSALAARPQRPLY